MNQPNPPANHDRVTALAKLIVDNLVRSEDFREFSAERSDDFINDSDRASRCYDAAEDGWDGSTHSERIDDMRAYWSKCLRDRNGEFPTRVDNAVCSHFDSMETFFEEKGTLFTQIG